MAQLVIDRSKHGEPQQTISITRIDPKVRQFRYVPNLALCQPGDLVLSRSISPGFIDRQIRSAQSKIGLGDDHSCWTHAAVFLYEDFIVEAVPGEGVITRSLYPDILDSILRIRRCPGLTAEQRYKIALCAQRMLGLRYDAGVALSSGLRAALGLWDRAWFPRYAKTILCSMVYYDAHVEITRSLFKDCPLSELITPGHLSATTDLADINVPWLKLS